jgi:hypothetical protein
MTIHVWSALLLPCTRLDGASAYLSMTAHTYQDLCEGWNRRGLMTSKLYERPHPAWTKGAWSATRSAGY